MKDCYRLSFTSNQAEAVLTGRRLLDFLLPPTIDSRRLMNIAGFAGDLKKPEPATDLKQIGIINSLLRIPFFKKSADGREIRIIDRFFEIQMTLFKCLKRGLSSLRIRILVSIAEHVSCVIPKKTRIQTGTWRFSLSRYKKRNRTKVLSFSSTLRELDYFLARILDIHTTSVALNNHAKCDVLQTVSRFRKSLFRILREAIV